MRLLIRILTAPLRSFRPKKQQPTPTPTQQKTKFTQQEITQMGQYRMQHKARNFKDIFDDKFQDKAQEGYLRQQKKEVRNQHQQQQLHQQTTTPPKMEKKSKQQKKQQHKTFKVYKHLQLIQKRKEEKEANALKGDIITQQARLHNLSRVRLNQQYLPYEYMKRVQKVFHKYDQANLRDIAFHFTNLMRLRYNQQKIDYELHPGLEFQRLQDKLPHYRKVEQIYLTSKEKALEVRDSPRKVEQNPQQSDIKYSQNIIVSYLLNRVPRTYAVAYRILTEIKKMFPTFQPKSFIDFGAGLSSGSVAFAELFGDTGSIFSVQPAGKMRKLAKYLTDYSKITQFQSLAQLSSQIKQVDIVYCGYVLNELKPELITVYLQALYAKVKPQGFLILTEYGNPFGARLIHQTRKWALTKKMRIAAPCPHHMKCPLSSSKHWCHFDQPAGMFPREVFGRLPSENFIKLQKYSYIIIQKLQEEETQSNPIIPTAPIEPNQSHQWDRILFPLIRRGRHFVYTLCTKNGKFQKRVAGKSHGLEYKVGRKLKWGDFWRFGFRIPNRYRKQRRSGKRLW